MIVYAAPFADAMLVILAGLYPSLPASANHPVEALQH